MTKTRHKIFSLYQLISNIKDTKQILIQEFRNVFRDRGVVIIFIIASLVYPILYCSIYKNEVLVDVPVAVVDASHSKQSAELLRHIDATRDIKITYGFSSMDEARKAFDARKVHGIIYIPADFNKNIASGKQATVSIYCDMSSFLYYRSLLMASNYCTLDLSKQIQVERLNVAGVTGEAAEIIASPIPYDDVTLYNGGMGFASFLMPVLLILFLHQTLFFGIGMLAGTAREENRFHVLVNQSNPHVGIYRIVFGKSLCYFLLYLCISFYTLDVIPRLYNLPHIGNPTDILTLIVPFLFATIFFSMTVSVFVRNRETGMALFLFFSLILIFLSGISWPQANIHGFWRAFSWIFPATHGIQAYVKINTMGATIREASFEYISLWIQTGVYFLTATWAYYWQMHKSRRKAELLKTA